MGIGESLIIALLGMGVVFSVLIILIFCITITSKVVNAGKKKSERCVHPDDVSLEAAGLETKIYARGSSGEVKIFDVPDRTAAMVMAVVSNQIGIPLNQLRFSSIKEITGNQ